MKIKILKPSQLPSSWKGSVLGMDIETEDKYLDSPICLVSLYKPESNTAIVVPIKCYMSGRLVQISQSEMECLKDFVSGVRAVGHNLQFDLSMIKYQWGVKVEPYFDTFIFARMMQFDKQGLKDIFIRIKPELSRMVNKFDSVVDGQQPPFVYNIDDKDVVRYSALDAVMPFHIMDYYREAIKKMIKICKIEMDYLSVASDMKANGLNFDLEKYQDLFAKYSMSVMSKQQDLNEYCGFNLRVNSTADLTKLLIDRLHLVTTILTPKGAPSMNKESLDQMMDNCNDPEARSVLKQVMDLKHEFSVMNTTKKIPDYVIDDKLTFNIEQIGYDGTARVYSKDTSVNQIPKEIREAIVPPKGKKFIMFDWSSAELYIAAYWSKCNTILDWYRNGVDLHSEISKRLLGLDNITKEQRAVSKVVSFATIYGSEGAAVSRRLNINLDEAKDLVKKYMEVFPEIAKLRAKIVQYAHKNYRTVTINGRIRRLPNINSDMQYERESCERQAFNTAIQASCADFFKKAAVRVKKFESEGVRYAFGVFDSHLLEVPEDMTMERATEIAAYMSDFSEDFPDFRFRFDVAEGSNWREVQDKL